MWLLLPAAVGSVHPTSSALPGSAAPPDDWESSGDLGCSAPRPWAAFDGNKTSGRYCLPPPENLSPRHHHHPGRPAPEMEIKPEPDIKQCGCL